MELAIPIIAMGGLYLVSKQQNNRELDEGFVGYSDLPNVNLPDENFPDDKPLETPELSNTEKLTHDNRYDGGAYTDTYFNKQGLVDTKKTDLVNNQTFTSLTGETVNNDY